MDDYEIKKEAEQIEKEVNADASLVSITAPKELQKNVEKKIKEYKKHKPKSN